MKFHLAFALLGPLLFVQGKYVRRVTPSLPEPDGERIGQQGEGPKVSLLVLGDSAAAGVGVHQQADALTGHLVTHISESFDVSWKLLATTGHTSADVLERLSSTPAETFETVVISIGVNDVTALTSARRWASNLNELISTLQDKFNTQTIYLSSLPPMHLFPALPQPLRWWLGTRARTLSRIMQEIATEHVRCEYVSIPFEFSPDHIAEDGFHPGPSAYQVWGKHIAQLIKEDQRC